jgi:hypothetical protein
MYTYITYVLHYVYLFIDWSILSLGFDIPMATTTKTSVIRYAAPCNLLVVYRRFGGTYCFQLQGRWNLKMEEARSSKIYITIYRDYTESHTRKTIIYIS